MQELKMSDENVFKAFSAFGADDIPAEAEISRRMIKRLSDTEDSTIAGPVTLAGRAALATSVVAHAVVELEKQVLELRKQLADKAI
jgi:hypothetical protein